MPKNTFKKGDPRINREGRPKGSKGKKTLIWEEIGEWFVGEGMEMYKKKLEEMISSDDKRTAEKGMQRMEVMMEYYKPKLARQQVDVTSGGKEIKAIPIEIVNNKKEDK